MSLAAPWFLLAVAAIALPLWLHRREEREVARREVASLAFFEARELRILPRRRWRQLLLLALRCALIATAALAFAEPLFPRQGAAAAERGSALHVLVIDRSLSMSHAERWSRALERAREALGEVAAGERAQLFVADPALRARGEPSADLALLRAELEALEPGASRLEYDAVIRELRGALERAAGESRLVVHLVSDFQRSALPARFVDLIPAPGVELRLHDVAAPDDANVCVEDLVAEPAPDGSLRVQAAVRAHGAPAQERALRLLLDDREVARASQRVPADGRAVFSFEVPASRAARRARVVLEARDALASDDERRLVLPANDVRPVLFVGGARNRAAFHLSAALSGSAARLELGTPADVETRALDAYVALVIADAELSAGAWERVRSFVASGGSALLALGPRLGGGRGTLALTGHALASRAADELALAPLWDPLRDDVEHPALGHAAAWRDVRVFQHARLVPLAGDQVLLRASAESPLLLEHALGSGRVLILASTLDPSWNDLALRPAFAPFARAALRYLSARHDLVSQALVDARISARAAAVQVFAPDGSALFSLAETQGGRDVALEQPGFYEIRAAGAPRAVAVNTDPRESDLRGLSPDELARWSASASPADEVGAGDAAPAVAAPTRVSHTSLLLALLLAVLAAELALGNWQLRPGQAKL